MKLLKSKILFGGIAALALAGCKSDQIGPDLMGASDSFDKNVTFELVKEGSAVTDTVKFAENTESFFSATFNEKVTWKINVTGATSGAVKTIKGTSDKIDETNAEWLYGRSSNEFFFQADEELSISLSITSLDTVYSIDGLVFGPDFVWHKQVVGGIKHIVVDKFDVDVPEGDDTLSHRRGLEGFADDAADPGIEAALSSLRVQGIAGYNMHGVDNNSNSWLLSKNHDRLLEMLMTDDVDKLPISEDVSPDNLYITVFVYGDLSYPNSAIELKVYELDDGSLETRQDLVDFANSPVNAYDQGTNDGWIYRIPITWDGWKQVTVPYSAFSAGANPAAGGNGNRVKQPGRISAMALSMLSYPTAGAEVKASVDYLVITEGGYPQFKK